MAVVDLTPAANGYAQILSAHGHTTLLRLHLDGTPKPGRRGRIYYAVAEGDRLLFAGEEVESVVRRFEERTDHRSITTESAPAEDDESFLESRPTALPTLRGQVFRKLAAQLSQHLLMDLGV